MFFLDDLILFVDLKYLFFDMHCFLRSFKLEPPLCVALSG